MIQRFRPFQCLASVVTLLRGEEGEETAGLKIKVREDCMWVTVWETERIRGEERETRGRDK